MARPRRKSSGLGQDITVNTRAPAMSTIFTPESPSSPSYHSVKSTRNGFKDASRPRPRRRKIHGFLGRCKNIIFRYTWFAPLVLSLIPIAAYLVNPTESNPLHAALFLSYPIPPPPGSPPDTPIMYGKGAKDFAFVAFYTLVLSFVREFVMQQVIRPLAMLSGIKGRGKQARFMEQTYTALYFAVLGPYGLWVMRRTPIWYFNTTGMFEDFPHRAHDLYFKAYYLLQAAYWAQQFIVLVLQLEKPRKDFKELVGHHIVTLALIWLSYRFHFTYMGLAVYITHDISDFFLATSKVLNYLDSDITGPYFLLFACVWTYFRHYHNLRILWAVLTEFATVGPYELDWETQQYKCWISQIITFALLASLQALNMFWMYWVLRIAKRYVFDNIKEDERSDNEDEPEDIPEEPAKETSHLHHNGHAIDNSISKVEPAPIEIAQEKKKAR